MSPELLSFLGSVAGLAIGVLVVHWLAEREARRWFRLWVEMNVHPLAAEVHAPTTTELQPGTEITCTVTNGGQIL